MKRHDPEDIAPAFSRHSHGIEVGQNARWLYIAGQVGIMPSGRVVDGAEGQMEQAWQNIFAVLESAGMGPENLVKVTGYLLRRQDGALFRRVRERLLGDIMPTCTLLTVAGLSHPAFLVEIEAVAAKE